MRYTGSAFNIYSRCQYGQHETIINLLTIHRHISLIWVTRKIVQKKTVRTTRRRPINFSYNAKRKATCTGSMRIILAMVRSPRRLRKFSREVGNQIIMPPLHGQISSTQRNSLAPPLLQRTARTEHHSEW